jgi:endo-1,4-beta-xylanase
MEKTMNLKRLVAWSVSCAVFTFLFAACGPGAQEATGVDGGAAISSNQTGTDGGYFYSFWTNGQGSANMTLDGSNGYSVSWSNIGDFTCGKGWSTGSNHSVTYSGSYNNGGGGAYGLYGWTTNPLVEYYVVEASGSGGSPASGTNMGTYTSDGATYTIYKHQQVNQPSIQGTQTFWQYISIRQGSRTSGTITTANHFNAWASKGMNLGSHSYQILLTEGWNGSGNASAKVSAGGSSSSSSSSSSGGSSSSGSSSSSSSGGSSSGGGSCYVSVSAGSQWSDRYNLNITTNGASTWTVTANMVAPSKVLATWNVSASYPSQYQLVAKSNGSGNNWGMTIQTNGTWTWPSFSCRPGN